MECSKRLFCWTEVTDVEAEHPAREVADLTPRRWQERSADRPLRSGLDRARVSAETSRHVFVYPLERDRRRHLELPPQPLLADAPLAVGAGLDD